MREKERSIQPPAPTTNRQQQSQKSEEEVSYGQAYSQSIPTYRTHACICISLVCMYLVMYICMYVCSLKKSYYDHILHTFDIHSASVEPPKQDAPGNPAHRAHASHAVKDAMLPFVAIVMATVLLIDFSLDDEMKSDRFHFSMHIYIIFLVGQSAT